MFTVAYLANRFPEAVEPYVSEEIDDLRRRGVRVFAGTVRGPSSKYDNRKTVPQDDEVLCLQPLGLRTLFHALVLTFRYIGRIAGLLRRLLLQGEESVPLRLKAFAHTVLGACYAVRLQRREIDHIHAHHGYFASWIAMVAASLLKVSYSLTLHGSDLLVNGVYLDTKLKRCRFCVTISEYNRQHILKQFPHIDSRKIVVSRLGVHVPEMSIFSRERTARTFTLLSVGRLHAVKDHAFLIRACALLRDHGLDYFCAIAGDGPERQRLESLIAENNLHDRCTLLGHVAPPKMSSRYRYADVVVLTSRSEGIPLVLMEAMARGRIVLAPAITGIPEIVIAGKTGFLYQAGVMSEFVERILFIHALLRAQNRFAVSRIDWMRHAARVHVLHNFNRKENLAHFADQFLLNAQPPASASLISQAN